MKMNYEERMAQTLKKEHNRRREILLKENRERSTKEKLELRRLFIIGELFCKHFPIAVNIPPGKSTEDDEINFKQLDLFLDKLADLVQCYQEMEDTLLEE